MEGRDRVYIREKIKKVLERIKVETEEKKEKICG